MIKVIIYFNSTLNFFTQLFSGFEIMNKRGEIDLNYQLEMGRYPVNILKTEINGRIVFFDLADHSKIDNAIYEKSDYYVKRMLLTTDMETKSKLLPYGLFYPVYFSNRWLRNIFLKDAALLKFSLRYWKVYSRILNIKDCIAVSEISKVESTPFENNQVIFRARLWDPVVPGRNWEKVERNSINAQRIELNRLLRQKFNGRFIGGIRQDDFSERLCPDLLISMKEFHKKKFLSILKKTSIGVINPGLEKSIGAKMGEYVAHSMAILTTPIYKYEVHGSFKEGENYLTYSNNEQCVKLVEKLFKDEVLRKKLQNNNLKYYAEYLHPEKKIKNILREITSYQV